MKAMMCQNTRAQWAEREKLRDKGQFWTPNWVAEAMVAYVAQGADCIFDPGVGKGAFYTATKKVAPTKKFYGTDIDHAIMDEARMTGIFDRMSDLEVRDFIKDPPKKLFKAIVANPPYIRHHRLTREIKNLFRVMSRHALGKALDGRAGLHIYFLIQALNLLDVGGRLAFIMPADTCEGVFSNNLWNWISKKFCIDGVVTFDHKATPFPGVDTNVIILLIKNDAAKEKITWAKCLLPTSKALFEFLKTDMAHKDYDDLYVCKRDLSEALSTGLSRSPRSENDCEFTLADFAKVMRGIATGANEFFFLTHEKAKDIGLPDNFLLPAIGRTRDSEGACFTRDMLARLGEKGRPTLLFYPNGRKWEDMPNAVKKYIMDGEKAGLPKRVLISTRKPWYKMETRKIPAFLFAYLGRRNARFIRNEAGIVPLTGFLCVYPKSNDANFIEGLWAILQHPDTIANLMLVGKSYGSGAIKVEPRGLEKLPISKKLVQKYHLRQKMPQTLF